MAIKKISGSSWVYLLQRMEYPRNSQLRDRRASLPPDGGFMSATWESSGYGSPTAGILDAFGPGTNIRGLSTIIAE